MVSKRCVISLLLALLWSVSAAEGTADYSFRSLGLPQGSLGVRTGAISADGSTVAGTTHEERAFRWRASTGFTMLGLLPGGTYSYGGATSADGSVVVGEANRSSSFRDAFRWTQATGMIGLTPTNSSDLITYATGVSADGAVVVGTTGPTFGDSRGFRWTAAGGKQTLPPPPSLAPCQALGVAAAGWPILGVEKGSPYRAFLWQEDGSYIYQGSFLGANAISGNGLVVVGSRFFQWNIGGPVVYHGGSGTSALAVNFDGKVMVGVGPEGGLVWAGGGQPIEFRTYLAKQGFNPPEFLGAVTCRSVSADGRTICGEGGEGGDYVRSWIATIDATIPIDPTSFTVSSGYHLSGNVGDLQYRDGSKISLFPDDETLAARIDVLGISPVSNGSLLRFKFEGSVGRNGIAQTIELRKMQTGTFTTIDSRIAPTVNIFLDLSLTQDVSQYIGAGNAVRARITWVPINDEDPAQDGYLHFIDFARWSVGV